MSYGQLATLGIIFQNSYGTPGDVGSIHFVPFLSSSLAKKIPPKYSENMRGIFDEGDSYEGPHMVEGDVAAEAQVVPLGAMLKSIMNETAVVNSDSLYTRTFKPRTADFDDKCANNPVTVYQYLDTGSAQLFSDLNGATLELAWASGEFLQATIGYVGGTFTQNASQAASFDTGKRFTWDVTSISMVGSATGKLVDLTVTLDDGSLTAGHTLNSSKEPSRIKRTAFRTLEVAGTIKFDDQAEYQQFIAQSERELIIHSQGVTAVQSGYNEGITVKLPLMRYEEFEPTPEGPGEIEVGFTARAKYSPSSGTGLQITHYSGQAAY